MIFSEFFSRVSPLQIELWRRVGIWYAELSINFKYFFAGATIQTGFSPSQPQKSSYNARIPFPFQFLRQLSSRVIPQIFVSRFTAGIKTNIEIVSPVTTNSAANNYNLGNYIMSNLQLSPLFYGLLKSILPVYKQPSRTSVFTSTILREERKKIKKRDKSKINFLFKNTKKERSKWYSTSFDFSYRYIQKWTF